MTDYDYKGIIYFLHDDSHFDHSNMILNNLCEPEDINHNLSENTETCSIKMLKKN